MVTQGVWVFSCPKCGNWETEPPKHSVISKREIEQVFVSGWGWLEKDFYKEELKSKGIPIKSRKTIEWTVKLADGRKVKVTQDLLIQWWQALANPTTTSICPFCGSTLRKRWVRHIP